MFGIIDEKFYPAGIFFIFEILLFTIIITIGLI